METLQTDHSPSPKCLTPFHNHNCLPPLKNLPAWTRSQFQFQERQTSPKHYKITVVKTPNSKASSVESIEINNSAQQSLLDKKVSFLQESHKEVLSGLQSEVETLKTENQALNFKLVMTRERMEKEKENEIQIHATQLQRLEESVLSLRRSLTKAENENGHLYEALHMPNSILPSNPLYPAQARPSIDSVIISKKQLSRDRITSANMSGIKHNSSSHGQFLPKLPRRSSNRFSNCRKKSAKNLTKQPICLPQLPALPSNVSPSNSHFPPNAKLRKKPNENLLFILASHNKHNSPKTFE